MNHLPRAIIAALVALVVAAPAGAATPADERPLRNSDVRPADRGPVTASERRARESLERSLGDEGVVSTDRITGAARLVARTDGFLTGRRAVAAAEVALDYVRARRDVFGLDEADLDGLRLTSRYRSVDGITHVAYVQTYQGVAAYDNVLLANVESDGRLLSVGGAAVSNLRVGSVAPDLTASAALAVARQQVGGSMIAPRARPAGGPERPTRFSDGDVARLTLFNDGSSTRLAWRLQVTGEHDFRYEIVVDAASGDVLARRSLTEFASAARIYRNHPAAGAPVEVDLAADASWLNRSEGNTMLRGNNAWAFADVDGRDGPTPGDVNIPPNEGTTNWGYELAPFAVPGQACPAPGCTWDSRDASTRATNRNQSTTQLFWFVNTFHDHLEAEPIGFTHAARGFEHADADGPGGAAGGDAVLAEADNLDATSAQTIAATTNNASMSVPPDGESAWLETYFFTNPSLNAADVADVVYHEYAHGLTNRSVGSGAGLAANQSRALGEGWSDWYALDYLVAAGTVADDPVADGELQLGGYLGDVYGTGGFRRQGIDCRVGSDRARCPGTSRAGAGGFTLGDLGRVDGAGFEVHDDGEIWAETLWDLRRAVGVAAARRLITGGLRLAPDNPSFLEARDAILLADEQAGGGFHETLWRVFAARGMGFSAVTASSAATTATEAFDLPPRLRSGSTPTGTGT
ncbi:MAG TPA: M36 family metallopeptidase, partial [Solirubrobacteraceae bacterium]|nr:M36 family metallopeptidase [Solirubrobacteraceae bacterium]